jgi:hypothetical protein
MTLIRRLPIVLLCAALALLAVAKPAVANEDSLICGQETARQEKQQAIPDRLLHAISLVESGRWDAEHRATLAWPWTVMAEGEGRFLPSKEAAVAEVRKLQARGVRNIDVGCMQINLLAHPDAFATLDEAFEPRVNVGYAAHFLNELYTTDRNWGQAGAHYHSQTPEEAAPYKAKLMSVWDKARGVADSRVQLASLEDDVSAARLPLGIVFAVDRAPISAAESAETKADPLARLAAERAAAKKTADAYRQAKLEEYRLKKGIAG